MHHLAVCDQVIREKGKVDLHMLLCILNGPPRVGKSTFLSRLIGRLSLSELISTELLSTCLAENVLQVTIRDSSITKSVNWKVVTMNEEAALLLRAILSHQSPQIAVQAQISIEQVTPASITSTPSSASEVGYSNETKSLAMELKHDRERPVDIYTAYDSLSIRAATIPGYDSPIEIFRKVLQSKEWVESSKVQDILGQSLNLYFNDVGGQPEFQEVLPAIIAGPSVFLILFKLCDDLNQRYKVEYVESNTRRTVIYESSFTVIETIFQSLVSIASRYSYVSSDNKTLKPRIILIGTHQDQASEEHIKKIQRELKEYLDGTAYYKGMVRFSSLEEPALTINNLSVEEDGIVKIRKFIERLARDQDFHISVPAPWLALLLSLRQTEPVISYKDCCQIANDCGINSDELKEALWFLHYKLGVLRYFNDIPELTDIVICDPQVIFSQITNLITQTFTFESTQNPHVTEQFKRNGIFSVDVIEEISHPSQTLFTNHKLILLLKHLNIIAPIYDDNHKIVEYFMSCVLSHTQPPQGQNIHHAHNNCPCAMLCICFEHGYCPKGTFSALLVDLMKSDKSKWRLDKNSLYRDQASFFVDWEYHLVTVFNRMTHIAVSVSATTEAAKVKQNQSLNELCNSIRHKVVQSLKKVNQMLHYDSGTNFFFGFYCPKCASSFPAICDEDPRACVMNCRNCKPVDLEGEHRVWFEVIQVCF